MWRRLGELCEELLTADEERSGELWKEIQGGALFAANKAAIEADSGEDSIPVLARCHKSLTTDAVRERCERIGRRIENLEDRPDAKRTATDVASLVAALFAIRCAGGEARFPALVTWTFHAAGSSGVSEFDPTARPTVPWNPFAWVRLAATYQSGSANQPPDCQRIHRLLLRRESRVILDSLAEPSERTAVESLLDRYRPYDGLHFEELRDWPRAGEGGQFPTASQRFGNDALDGLDPAAMFCRLLNSAAPRAILPAVLLLDRALDDGGNLLEGTVERPPQMVATLPHLLALVRDEHPAVRGLALRGASRLARAAADIDRISGRLGALLRDPVPAVRVEAARAALRLQRLTRGIGRGLTAQLADAVTDVRREAANAVAGLGSELGTRDVLSRLATLLHDEDDGVVRNAARATRSLARRMTRAIRDALVCCLEGDDSTVRAESLRALTAGGIA